MIRDKSLREVRRALQAAVDAGSLRDVARQVGMSAPGLRNLLDGGAPLVRTWRKLATWYLRLPHQQRGPTGGVHTALAVLVDHLPPMHRDSTARAMADMLRPIYERAGLAWPE